MEIKKLTAVKLKEFVDSKEFKELDNIPISIPRALSHINNPRLDSNDIIMFMAYNNNKFIGYLGAVPDYIFVNNKKQKIAWLSCMWVDKSMRGQGIAPKLLAEADKTWDSNLFIVNFTQTAKNAYDKIYAFSKFKVYKGLRLYRRLNLAVLLPNKNKKAKKLYKLLKFIDLCSNFFIDIKNKIVSKKLDKNITIQFVDNIDDETLKIIEKTNNNNLTKRSKKELDWIINYPWILSSTEKNIDEKRYQFSIYNKRFLAPNIKIFYKNKFVGFVMLNIRDNHLRTPYIFADKQNMNIISQVIIDQIKNLKIDYVTTFNNELINELKKSSQFFYKKTQYRTFLISTKLLNKFKDITKLDLQDGEGDSAFT